MTSIWTNYGLAKIMLILWIMSECDLSSYITSISTTMRGPTSLSII